MTDALHIAAAAAIAVGSFSTGGTDTEAAAPASTAQVQPARSNDPSVRNFKEALDNCETWCLFDDGDYTKKLSGSGETGDLPYHEWDRTSSIVNNSRKWVCTYNYDELGNLDLVDSVAPGTGNHVPMDRWWSPDNDVVDHVQTKWKMPWKKESPCEEQILKHEVER